MTDQIDINALDRKRAEKLGTTEAVKALCRTQPGLKKLSEDLKNFKRNIEKLFGVEFTNEFFAEMLFRDDDDPDLVA